MAMTGLESLRADMEKCFRCSLCKMVPLPVVRHPQYTDACPAARHFHFHGYSGSGKQIMALSLLDGRIEPDQALANVTWACTACGYCDVACKFIMDAERHRINMALRELLASRGLTPPALHQTIDNLKTHGRPGGPPPNPIGSWAKDLGVKTLPEQKAHVLVFAGCGQDGDPAIARRMARLLIHAGLDVGVMKDEPCCGLPAYWAGQRDLFAEMAKSAAARIEATGAKQAVVLSGSCLGAIRSKYPEYASRVGIEVVHVSELIAKLIDEGRLTLSRPVRARVTYHDPCYLGRQSEPFQEWGGEEKLALGVMTYTDPPRPVNRGVNGVFDAPRKVLAAIPGLEFIEMHRIREYSFCCGAGGGVPLAYPELGRSAARHRLDEANDVGAEVMVTACSHCEAQFRDAVEQGTERSPEIVDLIDLVFQAAGLED